MSIESQALRRTQSFHHLTDSISNGVFWGDWHWFITNDRRANTRATSLAAWGMSITETLRSHLAGSFVCKSVKASLTSRESLEKLEPLNSKKLRSR
jgi:hypothetical protein